MFSSFFFISCFCFFFFFNDTATTEIYTLSLHDALPICTRSPSCGVTAAWCAPGSWTWRPPPTSARSEEHTSELQSRRDLVCRLLLEKKKKNKYKKYTKNKKKINKTYKQLINTT